MEEEHYVIADLLNLASGSSSPAKNFETEAIGRELVISTQSRLPSLAREDSSLVLQASKKDDRGGRLERLPVAKKSSRPTPQASKKGRQVPKHLKTPGTGVEDFIPWVSLITSPPPPPPPAREEEEEEDEMAYLVHNFGAQKRKQGANFKWATSATPEVAGEASQQPSDESLDVQTIVVSDSPEMGFHGQSASEITLSVDLGEVSQTLAEVQEDIPSKNIVSRLDKAKPTWAGRSRSLLPDQILLNSYIPPQGKASPMEEVSVPGPKGA